MTLFPSFNRIAACVLFTAGLPALFAQTAKTPQTSTPITGLSETMVVLGSAIPVPLAESPRPVEVLPVASVSLAASSPLDILREDSAVFLEQRGAGGAQADIVLEGGSFEQTLVLVNGFRIDDAETAHNNLDLPIPMDAISSIEVLEGAGSTLHGMDALSGVVDFLTTAPHHDQLRLRAGEGSFEENQESLLADATHGRWSGRLAAGRNWSTGFLALPSYTTTNSVCNPLQLSLTPHQLFQDCQDDRDYRNEEASAESWTGTKLGITDLLFAADDRAFGANNFYGDYPSWERTKGWFASVRQELGSHSVAAFAYRRHTDEYVLFRDDPALYENNHADGSWEALLRRTMNLPAGALLLMGLEADGDSIRSFNFSGGVTSYALGIHARNRGAGYIDFDWAPKKKCWNLSAGAREEIFSGGAQAVFSPELAGSLRLTDRLKLRANGGYGFRIPTYVDLYYSDPSTVGNPNLKPESAWSANAGADWASSERLSFSGTAFYSQQHGTIDYVKAAALPNPNLPASCTAANIWCADNLNGLHFTGVETSMTWVPAKSQSVQIGWMALHGAQSALHGLQSEYVFNYPVENIHATWTAALGRVATVTDMVQLAERYQQTVYPVWNVWITHASGRIQPYLRFDNLSNTGYREIAGVNMPPRTIAGGFAIQFGR